MVDFSALVLPLRLGVRENLDSLKKEEPDENLRSPEECQAKQMRLAPSLGISAEQRARTLNPNVGNTLKKPWRIRFHKPLVRHQFCLTALHRLD